MRYLLIDEGACQESALQALPGNLAAAIFRLEQPQTPESVRAIVGELEEATRSPEYDTARRLVAIRVRAALRRNRKCPILLPGPDNLQELKIMLSQRTEQWAEGYLATGRAEGESEGRRKGRLEGRLEGEARVLARHQPRHQTR